MHRKLLTLFTATIFLCVTTTAQSMRWGKKGGSADGGGVSYDEEIKDLATDANGNIYLLANINPNSRNIDGQALPNITGQGLEDIILASFKCDGTLRWSKQIGNPRGDLPLAMSLDSKGGVYIAIASGMFGSGTYDCYVDRDTIIRQNDKSLYLIKYDTSGKYQWLRTPQPDSAKPANNYVTGALDMAVNANDEIELFCILPPGLYGGTGGMVANAIGNYMLRYSANGNFLGGVKMDMFVYGTAALNTRMVLNKRNGLYYISSKIGATDTVLIGSKKIITTGPGYVACFDRNGKNLWYNESKGLLFMEHIFAIDEQSNIYMAGGVKDDNSSFGGMQFKLAGTGRSGRPIIIKMDSTGKTIWGVTANQTSALTAATATAIRNSGELTVTGTYVGSLSFPGYPKTLTSPPAVYQSFIMNVNTQTGKVMWLDTIDSRYDNAYVTALAADGRNSVLIGGKFLGEVFINGKRLPKTGGRTDWYIAKYGYTCNCKDIPNSNFMWYRQPNAAASASFSYTGSKYTSIHWDFGDGNTSTAANPTHTYAGIGAYTACVTVRNSCGDHTTCYTLPLWLTDVADVSKTNVNIYPNPAQQQLTIEGIAQGTTLQLVDMLGRIVYRGIATGSKEIINTQGIATGSYILHLSAKDGSRESFRVEKN